MYQPLYIASTSSTPSTSDMGNRNSASVVAAAAAAGRMTPRPSAHSAYNPHAISSPSDYVIVRTIRQSIYGKVRLGHLRANPNVWVALKISSLEHVRARNTLEDPEQETQFMRLLSAHGGHPNVLRLYDDFVQLDEVTGLPKYHWQVLEFCNRGELFDLIDSMKGKSGIGEDLALHFFRQLVQGLKFIHQRGLAHLDISPENVLIDDRNTAKIIDFGMARVVPPNGLFAGSDKKPGKLAYMAPEVFNGSDYDGRAADAYSLGVVLFTMLVGFPPYAHPHVSDKRFEMIYNGQLAHIMGLWGLSSRVSPQAMDLMQSLLCPAGKRLTIEQVEQHPWLNPESVSISPSPSSPYSDLTISEIEMDHGAEFPHHQVMVAQSSEPRIHNTISAH